MTLGIVSEAPPAGATHLVADIRLAPGNSGGPLADAAGRVVGVNTIVAGGRAVAVTVEAIESFLVGAPVGEKPLGLTVLPVRVPSMAVAGAGATGGLLVEGVEPGSRADACGLIPGDLIVVVDGRSGTATALAEALGACRAGGPGRLRAIRGGRTIELGVAAAA